MAAQLPPRKDGAFRRTASHDDLSVVSMTEAAEARARAALHLAEEEANRADALQEELDAIRALQAAHLPPPPPVPVQEAPATGKPISVSPQALTLRGKHWKIAIPFTAVLTVGPLIWALVTDYLEVKRQMRTLLDANSSISKSISDLELKLNEQVKTQNNLRETVAELSGYLAGVLPKAGVKVPGAEPGAVPVAVIADPLPAGAKRPTPITTHTYVPAPKPR